MISLGRGLICSGLMLVAGVSFHAGAATNSYVMSLRSGINLVSVPLDVGNNSIPDVFGYNYYMRGTFLFGLPHPGEPNGPVLPAVSYSLMSNNVVTMPGGKCVLDEFDVSWIWNGGSVNALTHPVAPRAGLFLWYPDGYSPFNRTLSGTERVESGTPIELRPGGWVLLGREVMGVGTYENIVGRPPQEGHKVMRLRPGSYPSNYDGDYGFEFHTNDLTTYAFTDGAWVPEAPQLNVGEAAWFYAPPPMLQMSTAGTNALLSWPVASIDMQLQCSSQCGAPMTWTNVTQAPVTNATQLTVTVPVNPAQPQFYRLKSKL